MVLASAADTDNASTAKRLAAEVSIRLFFIKAPVILKVKPYTGKESVKDVSKKPVLRSPRSY